MRLTIKDEGSLLSKVMDREVTPEQVQLIELVLDHNPPPATLAYLLDGDIYDDERQFERKHSTPGYDAPYGAGDDVEAFRG